MSFEKTELPSGLTVITDYMPTVETVSVGMWVGVGARYEDPHENGVAHFLEHMAFKGTTTRSAQKIAEEIESVGGYVNAYTGREVTAYYVKMLKEHAELGVDIIADIMQNSIFDQQELDRERGVILQEIGMYQDTPDELVFDHFQEKFFPNQPMGTSILGTTEIISKMPRHAFTDFIDKHYGANRIVFVAAGNIQHQKMVDLVNKYVTKIERKELTKAEPCRYGGGDVRENKKLEQVHLVLGFPSVHYGHDDYYSMHLLSMVLGGGMSSRLFQEIREKRGLVYSIGSYTAPYRDNGMFVVYCGTGEKEVGELVPVMCDEIVKVTGDVTEEELNRSKAQMKSSILMGLESTFKRAEHAAQTMLIYGRHLSVAEMVQKIDAVTPQDVSRMAKIMLKHTPTFAGLGPISKLESFDNIQRRLKI